MTITERTNRLWCNGGSQDVKNGRVNTGMSSALSFTALMALMIACSKEKQGVDLFVAGRTAYAAYGALIGPALGIPIEKLSDGDAGMKFAGAPFKLNLSLSEDTIVAYDSNSEELGRLEGITG